MFRIDNDDIETHLDPNAAREDDDGDGWRKEETVRIIPRNDVKVTMDNMNDFVMLCSIYICFL